MRKPKDIIINNKTLEQILEDHIHWINKDCVGWETMHANLYSANLRGADLRSADLCGANLYNADLRSADLRGADLRDADLYNANLYSANLRDADLYNANLYSANLRGADLRSADLCGANLYNADLRSADLRGADLRSADLCGANLYNADLYSAKGKLIEYRMGKILTEDIIGYKKCRHDVIVTLLIPRGSIVFSINGTKCRTNRAKVIGIDRADRAYSSYTSMSYYVGDEFNIYDFNCEYNVECGEGIHFFMTKEDAEKY